MINNVYAIFDKAAQAYCSTFTASNNAVAARNFRAAMTDKGTMFNQNPADFSLWKLALWDDITGDFMEAKEKVIDGCSTE